MIVHPKSEKALAKSLATCAPYVVGLREPTMANAGVISELESPVTINPIGGLIS